jgi:hypothetical protein
MIIEMDDSYLEREYAEYIYFAPTKDIFIKSEKLLSRVSRKKCEITKVLLPFFLSTPFFLPL